MVSRKRAKMEQCAWEIIQNRTRGGPSGPNDMRVCVCVCVPSKEDNAFGRLSVGLSRVCRTRRSDRRLIDGDAQPLSLFFLNPSTPGPSAFLLRYIRARSRLVPLFHSVAYKVTPRRDDSFLRDWARARAHAHIHDTNDIHARIQFHER